MTELLLQPPLLTSAHSKIQAIKAYLNSQFVEREAVIDSALIALTGRFNLFLGGPVGTGKSQLAQAITEAVANGYIFDIQMFRQTEAMELLGPWNPEMLRHGRLIHVKDGYLQEALIAFIDEIDKGGAALQALLRPMNERTYREGREIITMPLRTVIGASNATLTDPTLAALMDRFQMRHWLHYVQDVNNFERMLSIALVTRQPCPVQITCEELDAVQQHSMQIPISQNAVAILVKLRQLMQNSQRIYSDRRWIQILKATQVHVAIEGGEMVLPHHLRIVTPFLTDRPNDVDIEKWVMTEIPAPPLTAATYESLRTRFLMAMTLKQTTQRIDNLKLLIAEVQSLITHGENPALADLKLELIKELSATLVGGARNAG